MWTQKCDLSCVCVCVFNTGGFDKMANMWDIRQPFSPIDKQEKGEHKLKKILPTLKACCVYVIIAYNQILQTKD